MDRETQLREAIREIHERARAEAQPYIDELVKIEARKWPRPIVIPARRCGKTLNAAFAANIPLRNLEDRVMFDAAIAGTGVTRDGQRIAPEDFYAPPEDGED